MLTYDRPMIYFMRNNHEDQTWNYIAGNCPLVIVEVVLVHHPMNQICPLDSEYQYQQSTYSASASADDEGFVIPK